MPKEVFRVLFPGRPDPGPAGHIPDLVSVGIRQVDPAHAGSTDLSEPAPRELTQPERDFLLLEDLDRQVGRGKLAGALCRLGAAHLTVCPRCRVDDFVHVEGCALA